MTTRSRTKSRLAVRGCRAAMAVPPHTKDDAIDQEGTGPKPESSAWESKTPPSPLPGE
jgi:hypothetical protein